MPNRPPYDFVYVHTDIPEGMTIRQWRAQRAASRPAASGWSLRVRARRMRESAIGVWRAGARALAAPRIARVRVRVRPRHRAPRPAAPPSPGAPA